MNGLPSPWQVINVSRAAVIWLAALGFMSCKSDVVPPDPPKDPRTYTWVCDTIQYPEGNQTLMSSVWGTSSSNVYIVGHNSATSAGTMFRWNGSSWTVPPFHAINGGPIGGAVIVNDLAGFSANSIFFVGNLTNFGSDTGFVMEYNGTTWIQHTLPQNRPAYDFFTIAGLSRNDLWVGGGWSPFVFHYNGSTWSRDSLPIAQLGFATVVAAIGAHTADDVWLSAYRNESTTGFTTYFLLHRTTGPWSLVDSLRGIYPGVEPSWGGNGYWRSPGGTLYSVRKGVFKLVDGAWTKLLDTPFECIDIFGISDQNFFVVGVDGMWRSQIAHYNGSSLHTFDQLQSNTFIYRGVWTDGKEAFIVGWDGAKSIVWRGK